MKAIHVCSSPDCVTHLRSTGTWYFDPPDKCPECDSPLQYSYDADEEDRSTGPYQQFGFAIGGDKEMKALLDEL